MPSIDTFASAAKASFIACISNADDEGRLSAHTSNLRAFHRSHKSLLVTRDLETLRQLEYLIANVQEDIEKIALEYIKQFMKTLRPPPRGEVHGHTE